MERITSRQNKLMQHIVRLQHSRSYRYAKRQFVAEGDKLLGEALRWYEVELAVVREGTELPPQVRGIEVPAALMQSISSQETPQGVLFVCSMPEPQPLSLCGGSLILDGIQDPGNLGTILRTADALEVPVVLSDGCADPYSDKTVRASMGAVFRTQPQQAAQAEILAYCRAHSLPLAVTALSNDASDIRETKLGELAVVIGSEGRGVCRTYLEAAQRRLIIPMNPRCESLNAAVAATIVMWQLRR